MPRNLLGELNSRKANNPFTSEYTDPGGSYTIDVEEESSDVLDFSKANQHFATIDQEIHELEDKCKTLRLEIKRYEQTTSNKALQDIHRRIAREFDDSRELSNRICLQLKKLKSDIDNPGDEDTTLHSWKRGQFGLYWTRYERAVERYKSEVDEFQKVKKQMVVDNLGVMNQKLTDEEIDDLIQDPSLLEQKQLVSDVLIEKLAHLEETRDAMKNIENGLKELLELFQDFNNMLSMQQERIDNIQENVTKAHQKVEKGRILLDDAEGYQQAARKNQCRIMICCLIFLLVVVMGGLGGGGIFGRN